MNRLGAQSVPICEIIKQSTKPAPLIRRGAGGLQMKRYISDLSDTMNLILNDIHQNIPIKITPHSIHGLSFTAQKKKFSIHMNVTLPFQIVTCVSVIDNVIDITDSWKSVVYYVKRTNHDIDWYQFTIPFRYRFDHGGDQTVCFESPSTIQHIDGLAQDCSKPIANAVELLQRCTKPSIYRIRMITCTWPSYPSVTSVYVFFLLLNASLIWLKPVHREKDLSQTLRVDRARLSVNSLVPGSGTL